MNIEKHGITVNCGTDLHLPHLPQVSQTGQSVSSKTAGEMGEMKAEIRNGPEAGKDGRSETRDRKPDPRPPVWELECHAWRFWLPNGSSRLTRDRELVEMLRERHD